jgi:hypothetical protein
MVRPVNFWAITVEGAIPELSNDMPEMKVLTPSRLRRKRSVGSLRLGRTSCIVIFDPFENDPSTYYLLGVLAGVLLLWH